MKLIMISLALFSCLSIYFAFPWLVQEFIFGCQVQRVEAKAVYITSDKRFYFYKLTGSYYVWSETDVNEGDFLCYP